MTTSSSNESIDVVPGDESAVLNPNAPAFQPAHSNERSLFLTFSNGFPLTEGQIFTYFNGVYKDLVEEVYVHKPREGDKPSLFGKIVFKRTLIPNVVMGTKEKVNFCIEGRPLYCRRFVTQMSTTAEPSVAPISAEDIASTSRGDGGSDGDDE